MSLADPAVRECADSDHRKEFFKRAKTHTEELYCRIAPLHANMPLDAVLADISKSFGAIKRHKVD